MSAAELIVLVAAIILILVLVLSCCVAAGNADRYAEQQLRERRQVRR